MIRIVVSSSFALCSVCFLYRNFLYLIIIISSFLSLVVLGLKFPGYFLVKRTGEKTSPLVKDQSLLSSKIFYLNCVQKMHWTLKFALFKKRKGKSFFLFCPNAAAR